MRRKILLAAGTAAVLSLLGACQRQVPAGVEGEVGSAEAERVDRFRDDRDIEQESRAENPPLHGQGPEGPAEGRDGSQSAWDPYGPVASHPLLEEVSWTRALEWWPHRPVFKANYLPRGTSEETLFAGGEGLASGTRSDPEKEYASLSLWYHYPPKTVHNSSSSEVRDGGGISIFIRFYPPGTEVPYQSAIWSDKKVTVRGEVADLKVLRKGDKANVDWLTIRWAKPAQRGGGNLLWEFGFSPLVYDEPTSIEFINRLEEIG